MTWVGGMVFLSLVAVPATRGLEPSLRAALLRALGRRFRLVGWGALGVLIVTGFLNAARYGYTPAQLLAGNWMASRFGLILVIKLGLVVVMVVLTLAHDVLSARVTTLPAPAKVGRLAAGAADATPWSVPAAPDVAPALSSWLARLNLLVALAVVLLAVLLLRLPS